jgi:hypothetical protein
MKRLHLLLYCGVTVNRSFVRAPRLAASLGADGASVSTMKYSLGRVAAGQKAEKAGIFAPVYRIDSWAANEAGTAGPTQRERSMRMMWTPIRDTSENAHE